MATVWPTLPRTCPETAQNCPEFDKLLRNRQCHPVITCKCAKWLPPTTDKPKQYQPTPPPGVLLVVWVHQRKYRRGKTRLFISFFKTPSTRSWVQFQFAESEFFMIHRPNTPQTSVHWALSGGPFIPFSRSKPYRLDYSVGYVSCVWMLCWVCRGKGLLSRLVY